MSDIKIEYATNLVDKAVLAFLANKTPRQSFSHWDIWHNEHAVSFTVAKMMSDDLLADVQKALVKSIEQGKSFRQFKNELKPILMAKGWWGEQLMFDPKDPTGSPKLVQLGSTRRLKLIFETNIRQAQAYGQWQRIWKNRDFFPYLEYIESTSDSQREQHLEFVGLILPVEHPFWDKNFPPNGYNCKCSVLALTKKDALAKKAKQAQGEQTAEDLLAQDVETANRIIAEQMETKNPRQKGASVTHHPTTHSSFAYNAGKERLEVLDKVYAQKHGQDALERRQAEREAYLSGLFTLIATMNKQLFTVKEKANPKVVRKLQKDSNNALRTHEAETAVLWFNEFKQEGDTLRPYTGNAKKPADVEILHKDGTISTVDLMYSEDPNNRFKLNQFNNNFRDAIGEISQQKVKIQYHLNKAQIVPLDLRRLSALNRAKIVAYIASLPPEQQQRIHLIVQEQQ